MATLHGPRNLVILAFAASLFACSSSANGPTGGPVDGAADMHCIEDGGMVVTTVDPAACHPDAGILPDTGMSMEETTDYGPTMFNTEGFDDDCKYHVIFSSTPVRRNANVTFTVVATAISGNSPVTGADALA